MTISSEREIAIETSYDPVFEENARIFHESGFLGAHNKTVALRNNIDLAEAPHLSVGEVRIEQSSNCKVKIKELKLFGRGITTVSLFSSPEHETLVSAGLFWDEEMQKPILQTPRTQEPVIAMYNLQIAVEQMLHAKSVTSLLAEYVKSPQDIYVTKLGREGDLFNASIAFKRALGMSVGSTNISISHDSSEKAAKISGNLGRISKINSANFEGLPPEVKVLVLVDNGASAQQFITATHLALEHGINPEMILVISPLFTEVGLFNIHHWAESKGIPVHILTSSNLLKTVLGDDYFSAHNPKDKMWVNPRMKALIELARGSYAYRMCAWGNWTSRLRTDQRYYQDLTNAEMFQLFGVINGVGELLEKERAITVAVLRSLGINPVELVSKGSLEFLTPDQRSAFIYEVSH